MSVISAKEIGARRPRARKDNGQEAAVNLDPLRERIDTLVMLYRSSREGATEFSEAVKACAESSGLLAPVVRRFIIARAGEKFADEARKVEQLAFVFEIGE